MRITTVDGRHCRHPVSINSGAATRLRFSMVCAGISRPHRVVSPWLTKAMNRAVLIVFAAIGLLDLLYGLFYKDLISVFVGLLIAGIAIHTITSKS